MRRSLLTVEPMAGLMVQRDGSGPCRVWIFSAGVGVRGRSRRASVVSGMVHAAHGVMSNLDSEIVRGSICSPVPRRRSCTYTSFAHLGVLEMDDDFEDHREASFGQSVTSRPRLRDRKRLRTEYSAVLFEACRRAWHRFIIKELLFKQRQVPVEAQRPFNHNDLVILTCEH